MIWERLCRAEADPALADAAAALAADPRRLVAVVAEGTPVAAARSLAATFAVAFARDRLAGAGDAASELRDLVSALSRAGDGPASIVLDGPDDTDALALLPAVLERGFGRELRVIVPCDRARAGRLAFVAGGYPRTSIAVVATSEPALELPEEERDAELLPLVLPGRLPAPHVGDLRAHAVPASLVGERAHGIPGIAEVHAASGDLVCMLGPDARAAVARRAMAAEPDAANAAIRSVLAVAPELRARLLRGVAAAGFVPDDRLAGELCAFEADELPAPLEWLRRGTPLPAWALRAIDRRAQQLEAGYVARAWIAKLEERPSDEVLALVERGLAATTEPAAAAELALLRAEWTGSADAADEALRLARVTVNGHGTGEAGVRDSGDAAARGDASARAVGTARGFANASGVGNARTVANARAVANASVRAALNHRASLREAGAELEEALADQIEIERLSVADDVLQAAAAAALAQARIHEALHQPSDAAACAERAAAHHGATGDTARAAFASMRAAGLHVAARDAAAGHAAASAACALGERTGDTRLVGYARWFLGALAERNADPAAAAEEYVRSLDAYSMLGEVPDRLAPSLERAKAAAAGRSVQLAGDASAEVQVPVDAALAEPFDSRAGG